MRHRYKEHTKKTYLQHYSHGLQYLGAVIKPHRIYIAGRTKRNFFRKVDAHNRIALQHSPSPKERTNFLSSINSYLGLMRNYKSYRLRKKGWALVSPLWKTTFAPVPGYLYIQPVTEGGKL